MYIIIITDILSNFVNININKVGYDWYHIFINIYYIQI